MDKEVDDGTREYILIPTLIIMLIRTFNQILIIIIIIDIIIFLILVGDGEAETDLSILILILVTILIRMDGIVGP